MVRLCTKILIEADLYDTDKEIRNLTGEYKEIEPECGEGVRERLEHIKALCKERNELYEKQNDLRGQKHQIERGLEW